MLSLKKLLNSDADVPLYKFVPKPDITLQELATIVAGMLGDPIHIKNMDALTEIRRHFVRVND